MAGDKVVLEAVLTGSSKGAVAAFEESAAAAEESSATSSGAFNKASRDAENLMGDLSGTRVSLEGMGGAAEEAGGKTEGLLENLAGSNIALQGVHDAADEAGKGLEDAAGKTEKLGQDLEKSGGKAGGFFDKLLTGAGNLTGVNLSEFSTKGREAAESMHEAGSETGGLLGAIGSVPVPALAAAAAFTAVSVEAFRMGMEMQSADAKIAAAGHTSTAQAKAIGDAFLGTAGTSEFSGQEMANAFAGVAGQLREVEGGTLSVASATDVMRAADDLATATQTDLASNLGAVVGILQAFQLKAGDAGHASDVLFNTSTALGMSVGTVANQLEKMKSKLGDASPPLGSLAGLMVDLTDHGETGRAALSAVSSAVQTLTKTATAMVPAQEAQRLAWSQLDPQARSLARAYDDGTMSQSAYTKAAGLLNTAQAANLKQYQSAESAVQKAQEKLSLLGVTVVNSSGQMLSLSTIIGELHDKIQGETQAQQLATVSQVFGASAANKMLAVVQAGPAAYDKATASVTALNSAHDAASKESGTLEVQWKTLKATVEDLFTEYGERLIPVVLDVAHVFLDLTQFLFTHKIAITLLLDAMTGGLYSVATHAHDLERDWDTAWNDIKDVATTVWHFVDNDVIHPIETAFHDGVEVPVHDAATAWSTAWGIIKSAIQDAWSFIQPILSVISSTVGGVVSTIETLAHAAHDVASFFGGGGGGTVNAAGGRFGVAPGVKKAALGGYTQSDGLLYVHAGEFILPPALSQIAEVSGLPPGLGGTTANAGFEARANITYVDQSVNIGTVELRSSDAQDTIRQLRRYQRSNGSLPVRVAAAPAATT